MTGFKGSGQTAGVLTCEPVHRRTRLPCRLPDHRRGPRPRMTALSTSSPRPRRSCRRRDKVGDEIGDALRPAPSFTPSTAGIATRASSTRPATLRTARHAAAWRTTRVGRQSAPVCLADVSPPPVAGLEPTLPSSWYRSEEIFGLEKERIFFREWLCVGREEELPSSRAHIWCSMCSARASSWCAIGKASCRAFYNVCRHRGARLCRSEAVAGALTRPCMAVASPGADRVSLPSVDLRSRRPPHRRPAT